MERENVIDVKNVIIALQNRLSQRSLPNSLHHVYAFFHHQLHEFFHEFAVQFIDQPNFAFVDAYGKLWRIDLQVIAPHHTRIQQSISISQNHLLGYIDADEKSNYRDILYLVLSCNLPIIDTWGSTSPPGIIGYSVLSSKASSSWESFHFENGQFVKNYIESRDIITRLPPVESLRGVLSKNGAILRRSATWNEYRVECDLCREVLYTYSAVTSDFPIDSVLETCNVHAHNVEANILILKTVRDIIENSFAAPVRHSSNSERKTFGYDQSVRQFSFSDESLHLKRIPNIDLRSTSFSDDYVLDVTRSDREKCSDLTHWDGLGINASSFSFSSISDCGSCESSSSRFQNGHNSDSDYQISSNSGSILPVEPIFDTKNALEAAPLRSQNSSQGHQIIDEKKAIYTQKPLVSSKFTNYGIISSITDIYVTEEISDVTKEYKQYLHFRLFNSRSEDFHNSRAALFSYIPDLKLPLATLRSTDILNELVSLCIDYPILQRYMKPNTRLQRELAYTLGIVNHHALQTANDVQKYKNQLSMGKSPSFQVPLFGKSPVTKVSIPSQIEVFLQDILCTFEGSVSCRVIDPFNLNVKKGQSNLSHQFPGNCMSNQKGILEKPISVMSMSTSSSSSLSHSSTTNSTMFDTTTGSDDLKSVIVEGNGSISLPPQSFSSVASAITPPASTPPRTHSDQSNVHNHINFNGNVKYNGYSSDCESIEFFCTRCEKCIYRIPLNEVNFNTWERVFNILFQSTTSHLCFINRLFLKPELGKKVPENQSDLSSIPNNSSIYHLTRNKGLSTPVTPPGAIQVNFFPDGHFTSSTLQTWSDIKPRYVIIINGFCGIWQFSSKEPTLQPGDQRIVLDLQTLTYVAFELPKMIQQIELSPTPRKKRKK